MSKNKFQKRLYSAIALGATVVPMVSPALTQTVLANTPTTTATATPKEVIVAGTSTIGDIAIKSAGTTTYTGSFDLSLTIPDSIKNGDTTRITTEHLPYLLGNTSVTEQDVSIDGVVVGKLKVTSATDYADQQQDSKTSLEDKKKLAIKAGSAKYVYTLTFNDKASGYQNKKIQLSAKSNLIVVTPVAKDTKVVARVSIGDKDIATKEYTITPRTETKDVVTKSVVNLSTNTRLQVASDGTAKPYLGILVAPMDMDYGKGSKLTVELPVSSMAKFVKESDKSELLTVFPSYNKDSFVNENGVYLAEQNPVKLKAIEVKDNKVVFEVVEGTLKRLNQYSITPENSGVNFALTSSAPAKMNAEGTSFGSETVTSSLTDAKGVVNQTQNNKFDISVIGAKLTASGVQKIINKPVEEPAKPKEYTTKWIEVGGKELKKPEVGPAILEAGTFEGYTFVEAKVEGTTTTYVFKKNEDLRKFTTEWVAEEDSKALKDKVTDVATKEAGTIEGYEFVKTTVDLDGNVKHIFKKAVVKAETPKETPKSETPKVEEKKTATQKSVQTGGSAAGQVAPILGVTALGLGGGLVAFLKKRKK